MIVIAIIAIIAAIIVPSFVRSRQRAQLTACEENEKSLATALEMYAADNEGLYPTALGKLTPNYLPHVPPAEMQLQAYNIIITDTGRIPTVI